MNGAESGAAAVYAARASVFDAERERRARTGRRLANIRLAAFLAIIGALVWRELDPDAAAALATAVAAAAAFLALVVAHGRVSRGERLARALRDVNHEARRRVLRDWSALPPPTAAAPRGHAYAADLDVFGRASLAALMSTGTAPGARRLRAWLLRAAPPAAVRARQAAVRELAPRLDFRHRFVVAGRLAGEPDHQELDGFLDWAEDEPWLLRRPALVWAARLLPIVTLALIVVRLEGLATPHYWALPVMLAFGLTGAVYRELRGVLDRASLGDAGGRHYAELIALIAAERFESEPLREAHAALAEGAINAETGFRRLGRLVEMAAMRRKNGLYWLILQGLTLWDFHVAHRLEHWQRTAGRDVRRWLELLGEVDALGALAGLAHDEPDWCFPEIDDEGPAVLEARALGHPLIPGGVRVPNDVKVGPPGSFLMVTGSNMSGKSTLLRAIGTNAVLAQAGGPVCARSMRLPPTDIFTSMRITDSIEEGLSLFMAELQRLKTIVDAAKAERPGRVLLFLLDEILHGTNTAERQVAVRTVLAHLLEQRAIGAISTHDLELAAAEPLKSASDAVHFSEQFLEADGAPEMTFDYRLRDGVATSTNALKLVRMVGLD